MLDFSPTFIIKPYHQKGGTEVPPYDIDKLLFIEFLEIPNLQITMYKVQIVKFGGCAAREAKLSHVYLPRLKRGRQLMLSFAIFAP